MTTTTQKPAEVRLFNIIMAFGAFQNKPLNVVDAVADLDPLILDWTENGLLKIADNLIKLAQDLEFTKRPIDAANVVRYRELAEFIRTQLDR